MLFNSLEFLAFFVLCVALHRALPAPARKVLLLLASYAFYASWDYRFLALIWLSTVVDFALGLALERETRSRVRRRLVTLSLVVNLGLLGLFKYAGFFSESFNALFARYGVALPDYFGQIVLPVGISFYTFQTLSYTLDVYRGRLRPTRSLVDFALFVAFFPQLVAGPIERASRLLPQIQAGGELSADRVASGAWLMLWGTFKKVVIADNLAFVVNAVYAPEAEPTGPEVILATYAFAFQIYCDFSGYTDVARGAARILGFDLMLNFRRPYAATSPADFWHRWHISLSTWLRDYLYISLGGNRGGRARTYRNLILTMVLGGLWHGAAWTFVLWGGYHGLLLVIHRALKTRLARIQPAGSVVRGLWWLVRVAFMFQLTCLGWLIFRAESAGQIASLLGAVVGRPELGQVASWLLPFAVLTAPLILAQAWEARRGEDDGWTAGLPARVVAYVVVITAIVVMGEDFGEPFIYFQF